MTIQIDSREKPRAIQGILKEFETQGIIYFVSKLYVGDYMSLDNPRVIIDRKQNLSELCQNICQDRKRFLEQLIQARRLGIKLLILCEHGEGVGSMQDVARWVNPRQKKHPLAMSGVRLHRVLTALAESYGVEYHFCEKENTGKTIIKLLQKAGTETRFPLNG